MIISIGTSRITSYGCSYRVNDNKRIYVRTMISSKLVNSKLNLREAL